jgi:hypothetical protein
MPPKFAALAADAGDQQATENRRLTSIGAASLITGHWSLVTDHRLQ